MKLREIRCLSSPAMDVPVIITRSIRPPLCVQVHPCSCSLLIAGIHPLDSLRLIISGHDHGESSKLAAWFFEILAAENRLLHGIVLLARKLSLRTCGPRKLYCADIKPAVDPMFTIKPSYVEPWKERTAFETQGIEHIEIKHLPHLFNCGFSYEDLTKKRKLVILLGA
jgi:hypothetical protein